MKFFKIIYKYEDGLNLHKHDVLDLSNNRVTYDNNGSPCSMLKLSSFKSCENFKVSYFVNSVTSEGVLVYALSADDDMDDLAKFVRKVCIRALNNHYKICKEKSKDFCCIDKIVTKG